MRTAILVILGLIGHGTSAQSITLTIDDAPVAGSTAAIRSGTFMHLMNTGANQLWDYSAAGGGGTTNITFEDVEGDTYESTFPDANLVMVGGGTRGYLEINEQGLHQHGHVQFSTVVVLDDPLTSVKFPNTMGTQWVDEWDGYAGSTTSLSGKVYAWTNGFGTLRLPWGDIDNVIRIMLVDTSAQIGLTPSTQYIMHDTTILYYKNGYPNYLLRSLKRRMLNQGVFSTQTSLVYAPQESVVGMGELWLSGIGIDVFPNPATERINVNATVDGTVELDVFDQMGKHIVRERSANHAGVSSWIYDISTWSPGIYLIRITDSSGRSGVRKVLVGE